MSACWTACHGEDGQGQREGAVAERLGYPVPPLWGPNSFNDGAGMGILIAAANVIRSNMPIGTTWESPALSVDDAWDVAAFVESQPRPHKPQLDHDYPNRSEKPVDTAYGPQCRPLQSSAAQVWPFAPIREAIKAMKAKSTAPAVSPSSEAH